MLNSLFFHPQNRSNFDAHFEGTGPEIWRQTNGKVDAFVAGAGEFGLSFLSRSLFAKRVLDCVVVISVDDQGTSRRGHPPHTAKYPEFWFLPGLL